MTSWGLWHRLVAPVHGLLAFALGLTLAVAGSGCASSRPVSGTPATHGVIRIKGSDTLLILARRWADAYMREHAGVAVYVEGGGTATGIEALIRGEVEITTASRSLRPDEVRRLLGARGSLGVSILCARDALSAYANPGNPVRALTLEQFRGVLTGRIRNWADLGGEALPIRLVGREPNSGTYGFVEEHILKEEPYRSDAERLPGTPAITDAVARDRMAIGYGGVAYGPDVHHCTIDGVAPTPENVRNGTYPLSRYLYLFTAAPPEGEVKQFVDWVLSPQAQRIVEEVGYIPLWDPGDPIAAPGEESQADPPLPAHAPGSIRPSAR